MARRPTVAVNRRMQPTDLHRFSPAVAVIESSGSGAFAMDVSAANEFWYNPCRKTGGRETM